MTYYLLKKDGDAMLFPRRNDTSKNNCENVYDIGFYLFINIYV